MQRQGQAPALARVPLTGSDAGLGWHPVWLQIHSHVGAQFAPTQPCSRGSLCSTMWSMPKCQTSHDTTGVMQQLSLQAAATWKLESSPQGMLQVKSSQRMMPKLQPQTSSQCQLSMHDKMDQHIIHTWACTTTMAHGLASARAAAAGSCRAVACPSNAACAVYGQGDSQQPACMSAKPAAAVHNHLCHAHCRQHCLGSHQNNRCREAP